KMCQVPAEEKVFRTFCKNFSEETPEAPKCFGLHDSPDSLCGAILSYMNDQKHYSVAASALWVSVTGSKAEKLKYCKKLIAAALPLMAAAVWTPYAGGAMSITILCLTLRQMSICYKLSDEEYEKLKKLVLPNMTTKA